MAAKVSVDIDMEEVYDFCRPIDRKKCCAFVRKEAAFQLRMRATDDDGNWMYPYAEYLAGR